MTQHPRMPLAAVIALSSAWLTVSAQAPDPIDTRMLHEMRWRMIGPHRASRTKALAGIPSQPHTFFIGVVGPVRVAERGDKEPVGIARIDDDVRDLLRVAQAKVGRRAAAVGGLVHAVTSRQISTLLAFAGSDVNHLGA